MKLFPNEHKRKKVSISMAVWCATTESQVDVTYNVVGVERTPLVVHRKLVIDATDPSIFKVRKGDCWTVTHVFSGHNVGIQGTYRFCSTIANHLLEEPVLYLPSVQMMSQHPDFGRVHQLINDLKHTYWNMGGTTSPKDPRQ